MSEYYIAYETEEPWLPCGVYDSLEELRKDYPRGKCRVGKFYDRKKEATSAQKAQREAVDELLRTVKLTRREKSLTLREAADQIGVHLVTLDNWEIGKSRPKRCMQEKIRTWLQEVNG